MFLFFNSEFLFFVVHWSLPILETWCFYKRKQHVYLRNKGGTTLNDLLFSSFGRGKLTQLLVFSHIISHRLHSKSGNYYFRLHVFTFFKSKNILEFKIKRKWKKNNAKMEYPYESPGKKESKSIKSPKWNVLYILKEMLMKPLYQLL